MRTVIARLVYGTAAAAALSWSLAAQQPAPAQVTAQDLRDGLKNPTRWLTYSRRLRQPSPQPADPDHARERESPDRAVAVPDRHARQIRSRAARRRRRHLRDRSARHRAGRSTRAPAGRSGAIGATCRAGLIACCGLVNRGFGVLGDRLFKTTLDAHVVAISRRAARIEWDTAMANFRNGYSGDDGAARRERQGDRRRRRRRVRRARFHRRVRRADRQAGLAVLHDGRARTIRATARGAAPMRRRGSTAADRSGCPARTIRI